MWKLEGNVPSFHGRLNVQDFVSLTFIDDSPPLYVYDEQSKELVATNAHDHSLGRVVAGTAKGDLCVFWQPRKSPDEDEILAANRDKEPAKWWEIPDEYTDAEINELVLEKIAYEPTARLVEVVPHDVETGNRFKISKQAHVEIDGIHKRLQLKPNSASLHARLAELKYSGPLAHQGCAYQLAYCKKNNLVVSSGADGRLLLWKCQITQAIRVPGVNTQGIFTPLSGTFSEGHHSLTPFDEDTKVFQLPTTLPADDGSSGAATSGPAAQPKPTSVAWRDDGKHVVVGTSSNCIWELNITTGDWALVFEARTGYMSALSCHPCKNDVVTVTHDGYLSVWDLERHACMRRLFFGAEKVTAFAHAPKTTCIEFHPSGDEIVIGMSNGELVVVSYSELKVAQRKTIKPHIASSSTTDSPSMGIVPWVTQLKYDSSGNTLAVGTKDTFIYVLDVANGYKKVHVCEGHSSAVLHLTWSADGDVLQSNAADGEVLFWSRSSDTAGMKQVTDAFQVRDTLWNKWSCVFGWATAGIWPPESTNLNDIACLATSRAARMGANTQAADYATTASNASEDVVAVANRNTLRMFRWPVARGSKSNSYHAHAALITSLDFTYNDRYIVSAGGEDGTLMQWRCGVSASGGVASPRQQKQQFKLNNIDDTESMEVATSPIPPPGGGRSSHGQPSPRHNSRQYRPRSSEDAEPRDPVDESMEQRVRSPKSVTVIAHCRVKHDFRAENADELNLTAGELLRVLAKDSDEWWTGESCDGTRGIFPSNFVEDVSTADPETLHASQQVDTTAFEAIAAPVDEPLQDSDPVADEETM